LTRVDPSQGFRTDEAAHAANAVFPIKQKLGANLFGDSAQKDCLDLAALPYS